MSEFCLFEFVLVILLPHVAASMIGYVVGTVVNVLHLSPPSHIDALASVPESYLSIGAFVIVTVLSSMICWLWSKCIDSFVVCRLMDFIISYGAGAVAADLFGWWALLVGVAWVLCGSPCLGIFIRAGVPAIKDGHQQLVKQVERDLQQPYVRIV
mmetsp:Transcript_102535/g.196862  ORF Transcript_102535/g.196862 Transcript_102535/m.196862 type:complete len:155 (-) Transcript_102535:369-833(-)